MTTKEGLLDAVGEIAKETSKELREQEEKDGPAAKSKRKWWQWFLLYPSILTAFVGAVPTFYKAYESYVHDVPVNKIDEAKRQNEMWIANVDCLTNASLTPILTRRGVEVAAKVCQSGDILLSGHRPGTDNPTLKWVSWTDILPPEQLPTSHHTAYHDSMAPKVIQALWHPDQAEGFGRFQAQFGPMIICTVPQPDGMFRQVISTPQGCFTRIINPYNGWVVASFPSICGC